MYTRFGRVSKSSVFLGRLLFVVSLLSQNFEHVPWTFHTYVGCRNRHIRKQTVGIAQTAQDGMYISSSDGDAISVYYDPSLTSA